MVDTTNPPGSGISDETWNDLLTDTMVTHNVDRAGAADMMRVAFAPFPVSPPVGPVTKALARVRVAVRKARHWGNGS